MAGPDINVILPLLCLLTSAPMMAEARQCQVSSDCPAHSPHCSDWGWCQWTDQYGDQGPRDRLETAEAGACSTDKDCSPRFPVCSNLGYCTVKDYFKKSGVSQDKEVGASDRVDRLLSLGPRETQRDSSHTNTIITNNNHNRQKQEQLPVTAASSRSDSDGKSPDYYENYDYNYYAGFEVLRSDAGSAPAKSIQHKIHGQFVGSADRRPGSRHVSHGREKQRHMSRSRERPVTEFSDYNYQSNEDSRDASSTGSTGGCLNDCVSDCVAITQLTAYRDCVGFCGKTCKD